MRSLTLTCFSVVAFANGGTVMALPHTILGRKPRGDHARHRPTRATPGRARGSQSEPPVLRQLPRLGLQWSMELSESGKRYTGGCLCGQVRYEAEGEPLYAGRWSCNIPTAL
jgi:hypothetical protein